MKNLIDNQLLIDTYEKCNSDYRMLITLLEKWYDINYKITDAEWETIKSYKSLLDIFFNDKTEIQKTIEKNEIKICRLKAEIVN